MIRWLRRHWFRLRDRLWPPVPVLTRARFDRRCRDILSEGGWLTSTRLDPCVYCGHQSSGRDHIVPKSQGGPDSWENRAAACRRCDSDKDTQPMLLFLAMRQRRRHREFMLTKRQKRRIVRSLTVPLGAAARWHHKKERGN